MRELFPTTQTAGKYHELPCDQTRWAAVWVWWTASSWPALKLLQIHPPQLERSLEDAAHLFNSCLGWILTFSDKEPAPKRPWALVSSLHWTPLVAEPKIRKYYPICSVLALHSHTDKAALSVTWSRHPFTAVQPSESRKSNSSWLRWELYEFSHHMKKMLEYLMGKYKH